MDIITLFKVLTIIIGLYMAWNIGANDVANAMGTSVGSKALTLKRAVIIAAFLEFSGAYFLGGNVSKTIQSGIINQEFFQTEPMVFAIGMMAALIATAIWLHLASFLRIPVSTTHAIIGAIMGFGLLLGGMKVVFWSKLLYIASSWIVAPLISGTIAFTLFHLVQKRVLFSLHPLRATKQSLPFLAFIAFSFFSFCLLFKGLATVHFPLTLPKALAISISIGLIAFFIAYLLMKKVPSPLIKKVPTHPQHVLSLEKAAKHLQRVKVTSLGKTEEKASDILRDIKELKKAAQEEKKVSYSSSEYGKIEKAFSYIQISSASFVAFAHGANDVANAIGPVAAVMQILQTNTLNGKAPMPTWILLLGGFGIVLGLATWGWRVIETIGKKITELTPTRGFCAEFGSALTILIASKLGLPISTTHALVGAVLGVGLARGIRALNLKMLRDIALSWFVTIPVCAVLCIGIYFILQLFF